MANVELVAFETAVDKLCADWVLDVTKLLQKVSDDVDKRTDILGQKIVGVRVPQKGDPAELSELPARVNEILKENSVRLKGIVNMQLDLVMDVKAKKLKDRGFTLTGHLASL